MESAQLKPKKQNKTPKVLSALLMALKVMAVLIYGIGYHIERCALFLCRSVKHLLTIGLFQAICGVGQWVIRTGKAIGRLFVKIVTGIAGNFVRNFSWWAPAIGLVCFAVVLVFSNFFSVALEVTINGNVVGYVRDEDEYHEILGKVENQIQSQLDADSVVVETADDASEEDVSQDEPEEKTEEEPAEVNASSTALNLNAETYALTTTTKYSLSVVRKSELLNEENLYTDVYFAVSELVGNNYGLYVNGELKAACEDRASIEGVLEKIKAEKQAEQPDARIEFVEDVQIKKGMFAADSLKTQDELAAMFENNSDQPAYYICEEGDYMSTVAQKFGMTTAQLQALNPNVKDTEIYAGRRLNIAAPEIYLQIKSVKTITYTESIAFDVKRVSTDELYSGVTKVKTEGVKGTRRVTAEVTYIDGQSRGKNIISSEVVAEPVDKVILVGTKKRYSSSSSGSSSYTGGFSQGSGVPNGNFVNPLPGAYLSCAFMGYSGHTGADLCLRGGTLGAAVRAADGGTVEYAGWSGGYGNLVRINHGNGFVTYYAHLSSYSVKTGDRVSSGQQIARAGSTGNSTGPHLHFEVRYNGTAYNPLRYISL